MSDVGGQALHDVVGRLETVSLDELDQEALLAERSDHKYLVEPDVAAELIESFRDQLAALEIDGSRRFSYRSTYFDTPALRSFLDAARRRRRRFKTRIRSYSDDESFFEVKTRIGRRRTLKQRVAHSATAADIDDDGAALVVDSIGDTILAADLVPTLVTEYDRVTLLDRGDGARITIDLALRCRDLTPDGPTASVILRDLVVIETKSRHRRIDADRWLWDHGHRPVRFSKYATSLAVLRPELPRHRWSRTAPLLTIVPDDGS